MMLPLSVIQYGRTDPLPKRRPLRAGPLSLFFEEGDLRYVRLGNREILNRVYVAVRDRNWGTVPGKLSDLRIEEQGGSFRITYLSEHRQDEIDFAWRAEITGQPDGTIRFTMDGEARTTFLRARIGFCVLHPPKECAGTRCTVEHPDRSREESTFPLRISPRQPFLEMTTITHEVAPGLEAEVRFEGDVFEMEDQRNWTDASFKTYCTPLRLPFPVEVAAGTRVRQSVTLRLLGDVPAAREPSGGIRIRERVQPAVTVTLDERCSTPVPRIGVGCASHGEPLSDWEIDCLRALNLAHLRVDLDLSTDAYAGRLGLAAREARALGVPLQVAVTVSDAAEAELRALRRLLDASQPAVREWIVFHASEKSTTAPWIRLAREHLAGYDTSARIGTGTNANFTELNRGRPPVDDADFIVFSINPQVHAFDEASLVETLAMQAETVRSAREFAGGRPIYISPVTLKPRFNPDATGPPRLPGPGELPDEVDSRQMSLFGAGWTLGSLKYLAEAGVESVTHYETTGWRGVMERESGSPAPFPSLPGAVFPLYHVLADAGEFAGGEVLRTVSDNPLSVEALALRKAGRTALLVARLTGDPDGVRLPGLGLDTRMRILADVNAVTAMRTPDTFRRTWQRASAPAGRARETRGLLPFAVYRFDAS
jgi:hypothetical protein